MLFYVKGSKPIPMYKVKKWIVVDNTWHVTFKENSFRDNRKEHTRIYTYDNEDAAIKEANLFNEYVNK